VKDIYRLQRGVALPGQGDSHSWGHLNIFVDHATMEVSGVTAGRVRINVGHSNPLHVHDNCDEIIVLLTGEIDQVVGEASVRMSPGDVVVIPARIPHHARSIGAVDADMIITYNSDDRLYRLVE